MKMIWGIFKRDMCHATRNVIAVIVSMGLVVVPALYAWFNIAASWDPYGNTKALKVAVANNDKGYKSDLIPVRVNVGETIISTLHANDQLDWQFVKSDKAIDGVKSGEYYAAIVIPKGFSADMMTLFSPDIKHAQLKYYLNEKINPIAPHITDQGATTVVNTIDKTFAKTIAQVGLDLASSILHYSQSPQMAEYMRNLNGNLTTTADTLSGASQQVTSYSQLLGSANDIVDSTGKLLASATKAGKQAQNALKQGKSGATSLTSAGANVTSSVNTALDQVSGAFDQVAAKVNKAFDAIGKGSDTAASQLATLSEQISSGESLYDTYITSLNHMRESVEQLPDSDSAKQALLEAIDREITLLEAAKGDSQKLAQQLKDASTQVTQDTAAAERSRKEILNRITSAKQSISNVRDDYATNVKPKIDALASTVSTLISQTDSMITQLSGTADGLDDVTGDVGTNVTSIRSTLGAIAKKLDSSAATVKELITKLETGGNAGDGNSDGGDGDNDAFVRFGRIGRTTCTGHRQRVHTVHADFRARRTASRLGVPDRELRFGHGAVLYDPVNLGGCDHPVRHAESDDFGPREGACAGLGRHAAAHRRPVRPGERLTLGTAPRPRVFRTVRDLRTARVAAGHTGLPG